jgi:hypothetical protein
MAMLHRIPLYQAYAVYGWPYVHTNLRLGCCNVIFAQSAHCNTGQLTSNGPAVESPESLIDSQHSEDPGSNAILQGHRPIESSERDSSRVWLHRMA